MDGTRLSLLGLGLYSVPEAARLLQTRATKLRRWAEGYTFKAGDRLRFADPVVRLELERIRDARILTFRDLIELKFVSMFREKGVSMRVIRAAAEKAAELFKTDHPFAVARFETDGQSIFAILQEEDSPRLAGIGKEQLTQELHLLQYVFGDMVKPFFKKLDIGPEGIEGYWPMGKRKRIIIDPRRALGKPIDFETGVPTLILYKAWQTGQNFRHVADWYEVPLEAVEQAVEYEKDLLRAA